MHEIDRLVRAIYMLRNKQIYWSSDAVQVKKYEARIAEIKRKTIEKLLEL